MIRKYDRVRVLNADSVPKGARDPSCIFPVVDVATGVAHLQVNGGLFGFDDGELELVCHRVTCDEPATCFVRASGAAVCTKCAAERYEACDLAAVRVDAAALVSCVCGESLDGAPIKGTWTMGEVVVEYRDCLHCHSTRPYMPIDELRGRRVCLYLNPETSEISDEHTSFLDALEAHPAAGAELRRAGVVLARVVEGPRGARAWVVSKPEREVPATM
jgi:hypothetical protein